MVSIIIPAYNVEMYIDKCLETVTNQTYKDIEIILINDGSTDGTTEKCRKWAEKDSRIILIDRENKGQGASRNEGIETAKGEYIYFVDSDDYVAESAVELLINAMEKYDLDICMGNSAVFNGEIFIEYNTQLFPIDEPSNIYERNEIINIFPAVLWRNMYRKSLFDGIRMPEITLEDAAIIPVLLLRAKRIFKIKEAVYFYVLNREESTMHSKKPAQDFVESFAFICDMYKKSECFEKFRKRLAHIFMQRYEFIEQTYKDVLEENEWNEICKKADLYYKSNFGKEKISGHKIIVLGNEYTVNSIDIKNEIIYFYDMRNFISGIECLNTEINRKMQNECNYVIVDLLRLNLKSEKNNIKNCNEFFRILECKFGKNKIIIFENYLLGNNEENNELLKMYYNKAPENIVKIQNNIKELLYSVNNTDYIYNTYLYKYKGELLKGIM